MGFIPWSNYLKAELLGLNKSDGVMHTLQIPISSSDMQL